jgi:hypothetical protein
VKGLSEAVSQLLHNEAIAARCAEPQRRSNRQQQIQAYDSASPAPQRKMRSPRAHPLMRMEQAVRVTDLLLQAGGFAAVVLDMASIAPEHAIRVPLATWFRYRAAAERTRASLLLLTQHPCAKSSAELLLRFEAGVPCSGETTIFTGIEHRVAVERRRFAGDTSNVISIRKPPQREKGAAWRSQATWAGAR